jgi:hypothetical protein
VIKLAPFNLTSAGLVLAAGFVTGPIDWLLWGRRDRGPGRDAISRSR